MLWKRLGYLLPWRRRAAEREIDATPAVEKITPPVG